MHVEHHERIRADFPALVAGVLHVDGIHADVDVEDLVARHLAVGRARLAGATESELPQVRAWRRAFAAMGLKPTQYRCASEALLRRLRRDGDLPRLHPLVDLCNAVSVASGIPVAALDLAHVTGDLQVRHADGRERYLPFGGTEEHPDAGEIVFVDDAGRAHSRRWTNRQSAASAVRRSTSTVLIVLEALHDGAARDVRAAVATLAAGIERTWARTPATAVLDRSSARFTTGA
jgi:DNA/RNA-binding domain of Phe-tRNA-synthetase-like protein